MNISGQKKKLSPEEQLSKKLVEIGDRKIVVVDGYLLEKGVSISGKFVRFNSDPPPMETNVDTVVYLMRPEVKLMDTIANQVQLCSERTVRFQLWFMPVRSALCEKRLEQRGVRGAFVKIIELPWNSIPIDIVLFPHLESERINLQLLQESACLDLLEQLKSIEGSKTLLIEQSLLGLVDLVAAKKVFETHAIDLLKFNAKSKDVDFSRDITNIIYLVRPQVELMETITVQVRQIIKNKNRQLHLLFVPRRSCLCENYLEEKGILSKFKKIGEVQWNFLPLDTDVVSMETPETFRDVNVYEDPTALYQAALGLMELQRLYGRIPKICGKGINSQCVWDWVQQLSADKKSLVNGEKGAIDQLIILDRSIDLISALATQLTYEGLVDEFFGIQQNKVSFPKSSFSNASDETSETPKTSMMGEKVVILRSDNELYTDIRNRNFSDVGPMLHREVVQLNTEMKTCSANKDMTVVEIEVCMEKAFVINEKKAPLSVHTNIANLLQKQIEAIGFTEDLDTEQDFILCEGVDKPSAYIENLIAKKADLRNVLRLMCLQCAAASGLKEKVLNYYKRELVHVYGIKVLPTISNLEKAGLLHSQAESRAYEVLRRTFNLTVEHPNEPSTDHPKDITFVHSIYAPLTVRIVEHTLKPLGWTTIKSQINNLPGPTFEDNQRQLIGISGRSTNNDLAYSLNIPRVVLVFFVGGCTYAEIAALRFLAQQEDKNVEFLIATTKIINKNSFLDSLMEVS